MIKYLFLKTFFTTYQVYPYRTVANTDCMTNKNPLKGFSTWSAKVPMSGFACRAVTRYIVTNKAVHDQLQTQLRRNQDSLRDIFTLL